MTLSYMGVPGRCQHGEYADKPCDKCEIVRLQRRLASAENGIGILRAALTDEQRSRVARICYETQGICFCGCHETEFETADVEGKRNVASQ